MKISRGICDSWHPHAQRHAYMDVSGTIPRKESVESSREQRPRTTQGTNSSRCRGTWDEIIIPFSDGFNPQDPDYNGHVFLLNCARLRHNVLSIASIPWH